MSEVKFSDMKVFTTACPHCGRMLFVNQFDADRDATKCSHCGYVSDICELRLMTWQYLHSDLDFPPYIHTMCPECGAPCDIPGEHISSTKLREDAIQCATCQGCFPMIDWYNAPFKPKQKVGPWEKLTRKQWNAKRAKAQEEYKASLVPPTVQAEREADKAAMAERSCHGVPGCAECSCHEKHASKDEYRSLGTNLAKAIELINGDRQDTYGPPDVMCSRIADLWNAYLKPETPITAEQTVYMLLLMKIAREQEKHHADNLVDMAGYIGLLEVFWPGT